MLTVPCSQISQVVLTGRRDVEQVRNCWNRFWSLFKCVRRRQEHTGGGDGDEVDLDDSEDGDDEGEVPETGTKRKKPPPKKHGKDGSKEGSREQFSPGVMDSFEQSEFYALIDKVYDIITNHILKCVY